DLWIINTRTWFLCIYLDDKDNIYSNVAILSCRTSQGDGGIDMVGNQKRFFVTSLRDGYSPQAMDKRNHQNVKTSDLVTVKFLLYNSMQNPLSTVKSNMWTNDQLRLLIDERKNRNSEYYDIAGSIEIPNLVRDHKLMRQYMAGNHAGRRSKVGERYLRNFELSSGRDHKRHFDLVHNANIATRRAQERRRNRTHLQLMRKCHQCNIADETREVKASLLRNSDISPKINLGHNDSSNLSSNLTNITRPNIFLSRNESDISMQDVGGSQPLSYMESINEEER
ncbi:1739_t:CDS:2, partial [Diversispora eburnea]